MISDIHNDYKRLLAILKKIKFSESDHLYVLGDVFDRAGTEADPVGVYFTLLGLEDRCSFVMGNHDLWLAEYVKKYYQEMPRKRDRIGKYYYNSFDLMTERITEVDMLEIADAVLTWPLQLSISVEGQNYLFAHAMTSPADAIEAEYYYLMGSELGFPYLKNGIDGYISVCGHNPTSTIREWYGDEIRPKRPEIWKNGKQNVYMIDCGCGFSSGRLACMRLEDKMEYYV